MADSLGNDQLMSSESLVDKKNDIVLPAPEKEKLTDASGGGHEALLMRQKTPSKKKNLHPVPQEELIDAQHARLMRHKNDADDARLNIPVVEMIENLPPAPTEELIDSKDAKPKRLMRSRSSSKTKQEDSADTAKEAPPTPKADTADTGEMLIDAKGEMRLMRSKKGQ